MAALLEARSLSVRFGQLTVIADLDLDVEAGTIHSVIGPNGAGKTTLFNALSGFRPPTGGKVTFHGRDVTRLPPHGRVAIGMARSFQVTNIFQDLSVSENLRLSVQAANGRSRAFWVSPAADTTVSKKVEELLELLCLQERAGNRAGTLSHGGQRALEIGMALASDPALIFLDEPLAGMGIDDIARTKHLIRSLVPQRTVLLVEHNMSVVLDISDRITVLAGGNRIAEGSPQAIRADEGVRHAYLGAGS